MVSNKASKWMRPMKFGISIYRLNLLEKTIEFESVQIIFNRKDFIRSSRTSFHEQIVLNKDR